MALKRICYTCGREYEYCPTCAGFKTKPRWMCNWDSEECKDVFQVLTANSFGDASKDDVKAVLDKYGVKDYSKYQPSIQAHIEKVLKTSKKKSNEVEI